MLQKNTSSANERSIISAEECDHEKLASFLSQNNQIHRHLDWFAPLDWLGKEPFLLELADDQIVALLCAAPENEQVAWVRVYGVMKHLPEDDSWHRLLTQALSHLRKIGVKRLAALSLHSWFERLLNKSGFRNRQNIVVLEWGGDLPNKNRFNSQITIRPMQYDDIQEVAHIDRLAFPPLWQNCRAGLEKAYNQTGISTVALIDDEIVGYQISTTMTIYGHLARLAVRPEFQRQGIAFSLVHDLLSQFKSRGYWRVTVNTQSDNKPSLKLYNRFGFTRTSEQIPVYEIKI